MIERKKEHLYTIITKCNNLQIPKRLKKHSDEKLHHYAATIACCNKLVRQFYYRFRDLTITKELIIK